MPLMTIVEDYVFAAMSHAKGNRAENGTLILTAPEFPGIVACASDIPTCYQELYRQLERWIARSLQLGYSLPVMQKDGERIDLNTVENRQLAAYHTIGDPAQAPAERPFMTDAKDLDAFFQSLDDET